VRAARAVLDRIERLARWVAPPPPALPTERVRQLEAAQLARRAAAQLDSAADQLDAGDWPTAGLLIADARSAVKEAHALATYQQTDGWSDGWGSGGTIT